MWTGSHNLSELSSPSIRCSFIGIKQRKWKWRKVRHMPHGYERLLLIGPIHFYSSTCHEGKKRLWKVARAVRTHHVDNLLCPCTAKTTMQQLHPNNCTAKITPKQYLYHICSTNKGNNTFRSASTSLRDICHHFPQAKSLTRFSSTQNVQFSHQNVHFRPLQHIIRKPCFVT